MDCSVIQAPGNVKTIMALSSLVSESAGAVLSKNNCAVFGVALLCLKSPACAEERPYCAEHLEIHHITIVKARSGFRLHQNAY